MKIKCEMTELIIGDLGLRLKHGDVVSICDEIAAKSRDLSKSIGKKFVTVLRFREQPTIVVDKFADPKSNDELKQIILQQQEQLSNTNDILGRLSGEINSLKTEPRQDLGNIVSDIVEQVTDKIKGFSLISGVKEHEKQEIPSDLFNSLINKDEEIETNISDSTVEVKKDKSIKCNIELLKKIKKN